MLNSSFSNKLMSKNSLKKWSKLVLQKNIYNKNSLMIFINFRIMFSLSFKKLTLLEFLYFLLS